MKLHHERARKMQVRANDARARPAGKQLLIEHINLAKVTAGDGPEKKRLLRGIKFLLEAFPPEERVPEETEAEAAEIIGGNPHNKWYVNLARKEGKLVGASSLLYLDDAATLFIGYVRATAGMRGQGLKMLIERDGAAFARAAAKDAGNRLRTFSGEMEIPEVVKPAARAEAEERIAKFMRHGWGILGRGTSFSYGQPLEDGGFWPLQLMVKPLEEQKKIDPPGVVTMVRSIYASIYDHLPKGIYDTALKKILDSIPKEPLRIVS
jgi:hypothetical protein